MHVARLCATVAKSYALRAQYTEGRFHTGMLCLIPRFVALREVQCMRLTLNEVHDFLGMLITDASFAKTKEKQHKHAHIGVHLAPYSSKVV